MGRARPATIVVVETCPAAQELIDQTLRDCGHRVLVTGDPNEPASLAWRIRVDLLVGTDEEAVGPVADLLRVVQPDVRVLTLSGPVSLDELQRAVDEELT